MVIDELLNLPRAAKRLILAAGDCLFVAFALWLVREEARDVVVEINYGSLVFVDMQTPAQVNVVEEAETIDEVDEELYAEQRMSAIQFYGDLSCAIDDSA
jgi:hypothetical protein